MFKGAAVLFGFAILCGAAGAASAQDAMPVGPAASPPIGYVRFCEERPDACGNPLGTTRAIALTEPNYVELERVNDYVNSHVEPLTDLEHYGTVERWTYPDDGYGDCEDYVLEKQRRLIGLGWPRETLLVTVVRDKNGDGHSVLTVRTDRGDLVLDNQEPQILPWVDTGYRYVKRQSQTTPDAWVALGDPRPTPTVGRSANN